MFLNSIFGKYEKKYTFCFCPYVAMCGWYYPFAVVL